MNVFEQFHQSLPTPASMVLEDVNDFAAWLNSAGPATLTPGSLDDVLIRTYLLDVHLSRHSRASLKRVSASLQVFFDWLVSQGLLSHNPIESGRLSPSALAQEQAENPHRIFLGTPASRQLARLKALNHLSALASQTPDVRSLLDVSLKTLLDVLSLKTGWVSLDATSGLLELAREDIPAHGFVLAAACNLPPALEQSARLPLTRPPACTCQRMLSANHLGRAVNIVECSRLRDATQNGASAHRLMYHASVPLKFENRAVALMNFATEDWLMFSAEDLALFGNAAQILSAALERAHLFDVAQKNRIRLEQELYLARRMQMSLLPEALPAVPGYCMSATWQPAHETSGDYYNVFLLGENQFAFALADVCGKGAPAALCTTMLHSLIRERVEWLSPAQMLTEVNRRFYQVNDGSNFVTCIYAVLNASTGRLTYAIAGHEPPLLRRGSGALEQVVGGGSALGIFSGAQYEEHQLELGGGDCLLLFTDGLTEAMDLHGNFYSLERVKQVLAHSQPPARAVLEDLQEDVRAWQAGAAPADDITMLALGRNAHECG